jgi:hypothetical protein
MTILLAFAATGAWRQEPSGDAAWLLPVLLVVTGLLAWGCSA